MAEVRVGQYFSTCDTHMEPFSKRAWVRFEDYYTLRKLCGELNDTLILVRERIDLELEVVPVLWHKSVISQCDAAITRAQEVLNEPR